MRILAFAALVIFASLALAQGLEQAKYTSLAKYLGEGVLAATVMLLMIALILAAIVYMFGGALGNDKMKSWGRVELFEILYSAIILGMLSFMIISFNDVVTYIAKDSVNDPIATQICIAGAKIPAYENVPFCHIRLSLYFLNNLFDELNRTAAKIYIRYLVTSTISELAVNMELLNEMGGFFTFNPFRGFVSVGNVVSSELFDYLTKLMLLAKFQEIFIAFVATAFFPVILSAGIALRSFSFTRRLGGLLMGLALGLFFVLPMFYVLGAFVMDAIKLSAYAKEPGKYPDGPESVHITDNIYLTGSVPTLSGKDMDLAKESEAELEKLVNSRARQDLLKDGVSFTDEDGNKLNVGSLPNLAPTNKAEDDAIKEKLKSAYLRGYTYYKSLSEKDLRDRFASHSFERGGLIDGVASLSFFSLFFTLFGIMGTIAAIRSFSITLGGDIEIAGLTHLI